MSCFTGPREKILSADEEMKINYRVGGRCISGIREINSYNAVDLIRSYDVSKFFQKLIRIWEINCGLSGYAIRRNFLLEIIIAFAG